MANDPRTTIIPRRTPESAAMVANVKRAMAITAALNRLTFDDAAEVRAMFSQLIGQTVDDSFSLIPPFYTESGVHIRVGRNVFVNQNCTFYDLGGIDIADDVLIGPNVSLITSGHSHYRAERRAAVIAEAHRDRGETSGSPPRDGHRRRDYRREFRRRGGFGWLPQDAPNTLVGTRRGSGLLLNRRVRNGSTGAQ